MSAGALGSVPPLKLWLGALLLAVALHGQFLYSWAGWMWGREHYQFFPLILAGCAWLVWQRLPLIRWPSAPALSVRVAIYLLISVGLFLLAVKTGSHWLGLISCLAAIWTSVWYVGGSSAADELRWPLLFLGLLVPLPLNLDLQVIVGLQKAATWLASGALDLRHVRHTVSGVAIRTESKTFMVEEACSGIHSLFSAVSAMIFLAIYRRYGLVRIVLTFVQTVFWVLVANAIRVFLIVFADTRWQIPLDSGWRHDALGVLTYSSILACACSTDQFLRFLFPEAHGALLDAQKDVLDQIIKPWRKFVADTFDRRALHGRLAVVIPLVLVLAVYVPLGGVAVARQLLQPAAAGGQINPGAGALQSLQETALSVQLAGWTRAGFQTLSRDPDDPFGMSSSVWTFAGSGLNASISLDGFYPEWHDLAYCYVGSGWKLISGENGETLVQETRVPHTRLRLYKNSGEFAVVYFSCFDSTKAPVNPPEATGSLWRYLKNRLVAGGLAAAAQQSVVPPVFQIQLMVGSDREFLPHELEALESLFRAARVEILGQIAAGQ